MDARGDQALIVACALPRRHHDVTLVSEQSAAASSGGGLLVARNVRTSGRGELVP